MEFFRQIFRYLIINVVMFALYYILNTLFQPLATMLELQNSAAVYDVIISVLTWIGFLGLHIARITDRKGYGINYLYKLESHPASPASAFNIFTDWKRGNWEFLAYVIMVFIPLTSYAKAGVMTWGQPSVLTEIFLPQTLFFKLTGSPLWGLLLTLGIFYLVTAFTQVICRKKWLASPLSDDERMRVDPDWQPAETPAEEPAELPEEKPEEEKK